MPNYVAIGRISHWPKYFCSFARSIAATSGSRNKIRHYLLCRNPLLRVAHALGRRAFRSHWHKYAPKKFTVPQLFACLVLKEFLRLDYRKFSALLEEAPGLVQAIGLTSVPHFTTLQKAAVRLLEVRRAQRLLDRTVSMAQEAGLLGQRSKLAALDSTGLESTTASRYDTSLDTNEFYFGAGETVLVIVIDEAVTEHPLYCYSASRTVTLENVVSLG
jgi:hypothetical protein